MEEPNERAASAKSGSLEKNQTSNECSQSRPVGQGETKSGTRRKPTVWRGISPNAEKPYAWFSLEGFGRCLEVSDKAGLAVYVALCALEARTAERFKPHFFASRAEIVRASGVSKNYLTRILLILEQANLIEVRRPTGKAKIDHASNQYTILSRSNRGTKQGLPKEQKRDSRRTTDSEENRDTIKSIPLPKGERDYLRNDSAQTGAGDSPTASPPPSASSSGPFVSREEFMGGS